VVSPEVITCIEWFVALICPQTIACVAAALSKQLVGSVSSDASILRAFSSLIPARKSITFFFLFAPAERTWKSISLLRVCLVGEKLL
jgi:hypothetical protein